MKKQTYALVTGASSGLGVDFAEILAAEGYNIILTARRRERMEALKEELVAKYAVAVEVIEQDLATPTAADELYAKVQERGIVVDVLINNAGYGVYGRFTQIEWGTESKMMQLDMVTLVHLTKLFSKDMVARNTGYILLIASIGAYQPTPTYATYAAAKSFVLSFGEALNYELKNTNVNITVLSPGITATEFLKVSGQEATFYQRMAMMESRPVAEIGIRAMFRGKASIVPGFLNKLSAFSVRFIPRRWQAALAYVLMRTEATAQ